MAALWREPSDKIRMSFRLIWHPHGVVKQFLGTVTGEDILKSNQAVEADSRFDFIHYCINDFLSIDGFRPETALQPVADEIAATDYAAGLINSKIKVAIVTTDADLIRVSQQYATSDMNPYETRIFSSLNEANEWSGFP